MHFVGTDPQLFKWLRKQFYVCMLWMREAEGGGQDVDKNVFIFMSLFGGGGMGAIKQGQCPPILRF